MFAKLTNISITAMLIFGLAVYPSIAEDNTSKNLITVPAHLAPAYGSIGAEIPIKYPPTRLTPPSIIPLGLLPTTSPGTQVGTTTYDYQHNASMGRQIEHRGSDNISMVWTCSYSTNFGEQRNIRYNRYNLTSCSQVSIHASYDTLLFPTHYSGYVSLDVDPVEGCPVLGYHSASTGDAIYNIVFDLASCYNPNAADFVRTWPMDGYGYYTGSEFNIWPKVEWQVGTETVLHMVATEYSGQEAATMSYYRRVGPYGTGGPFDDTLIWSDQHVIDTVISANVVIAASSISDKVAIVWAAPCDYVRDTPDEFDSPYAMDIWFALSETQGEDWASAPTPANPSIGNLVDNDLLEGRNVTTYGATDEYKAYCDISALFDSGDTLHIVWSGRHWTDGITIDRRNAAIFHWDNGNKATVPVVIADWDEGGTCYGHYYYSGDVAKLSLSECDGKLYVLYTQFGNPEAPCADKDAVYSTMNGELYLVASKSNGMVWDTPQNLTNSETPDCALGDCDSDNWASMARYGRPANGCGGGDSPPSEGYALDILYINDKAPGGVVSATSGAWTVNPVMWLTTPCREVIYGGDQFYEAVNYDPDGTPWSIVAADFDNDGDNDVVTANLGSISVMKNNGDGSFAGPSIYLSDGSDAIAYDLDGDGYLDLALKNSPSNSVLVHINKGDGSFDPAVSYGVGTVPRAICGADLDGDHDIDLVTANYGSSDVSVLINEGGVFTLDANYNNYGQARGVVAADLDGDGDQDLAVAGSNTGDISVHKNVGDGIFDAPSHYDAGGGLKSISAADLDGDGDIDLAATYYETYVVVFMNFGDGTFDTPVKSFMGGELSTIRAFDMDRDNDYDLVATNRYSNCISVLENKGDGIFEHVVRYATGEGPTAVYAVDLNGDYNRDLAVANYSSGNVSILINTDPPPEPGDFSPPVHYHNIAQISDLIAIDIDGDSDPDLAASHFMGNYVFTLENDGHGVMTKGDSSAIDGNSKALAVGDFDEINGEDLAVSGYGLQAVCLLINNGSGNFTYQSDIGVGSDPRKLCAADLDDDGHVDLVAPNYGDNSISIRFGNGDGSFATEQILSTGSSPLKVIATRLDQDTDLDLAVVNFSGNDISTFLNAGSRTFTGPFDYDAGITPVALCAADMDSDSDMDLMVPNNFLNQVTQLSNDGGGSFNTTSDFAVGSFPSDVCAVDLDNDNDSDLVVTYAGSDSIGIFLNNGSGALTWNASFPVGREPSRVIAIDVDNDGDQDLAVGHTASKDICILFNLSPVRQYICGDANGDESLNVGDAVHLINYVFKGGPAPDPEEAGDPNCDGSINVGDAVYMINFVFKGGPVPCAACP